MRYVLLFCCIQLFGQVWSEDLVPPQDVHVDSLLRWTPAPEHRNVTYTAQYRSFDTSEWYNVPACVRTQLNSCDVTAVKAMAEKGCVELRVRAQKRGLTSRWVEACSRRGDFCSPEVQLTALPGFLTVNLSTNNSMAEKYAAHSKHRVYFGRDGEPLQEYGDFISSKSIKDLEEEARYCVKVQFILYYKVIGPPSCTLCEVIPQSSTTATQTKIIAAVVTVVILFIMLPAISYIIIYERERIKQLMQPPYSRPKCIDPPLPEPRPICLIPPSEERFDELTFEFREEEYCQRA